MFFIKKDDTMNDANKNKKILLMAVSLILIIFIIFLIVKLSNKQVVYEDRLYYINLVGDSNITLYLGEEYVEPGYKGTDDKGKDLTPDVAIENNIDVNSIGNYKVTYTLGNITKERNVKVIEKSVGATHIHLYGDMNIFLYVGEKYQEKGYEVVDTVDGASLKDKVTINSNVDTSKEGIYHIIYSVTNTSGVTTSIQRSVVVMDRTLSLLTDTTEMTNKNVTINIYAKDEMFDYLILPNNNKTKERISTYEVSSNGTYKFIMYNTKGESKEKSITISNIDKESPSGSCSGYHKSGISQIEVKANDNVGIGKYIIDGTTYTSSSIKLNKEVSSVNITIYDKAGNSKAISCNLTNKNPKTTTTTSKTTATSKTTTTTTRTTTTTGAPLGTNPGFTVTYDYAIYVPENATANMPLYIILPPNDSDYTYKVEQNFIKNWPYGKFPIFVLIPRNPKSYSAIRAKADELINKYRIDKSRIYATGFSSSGTYVYYLVGRNQDFFAALVVFSSGMSCDHDIIKNNMNYFKTLPTKGYGEIPGQYDQDGHKCGGWTTWSPVSAMTRLFDCLGRSEDFTPVGKICHDKVHEYAYHQDNDNSGQSDLLEWMLKQTKKW